MAKTLKDQRSFERNTVKHNHAQTRAKRATAKAARRAVDNAIHEFLASHAPHHAQARAALTEYNVIEDEMVRLTARELDEASDAFCIVRRAPMEGLDHA
jgi:uncharacterized membrane protein YcjF (UPF0283 family)